MTVFSMTDARHEFTKIANQVMIAGERIFVSKNNTPAFAVVPISDVELLEALENKIDLEEALTALKEPGTTSLENLKKQLGMSA
ncbi:MAG TPA: type II toxin-antitoxin system prevent-host-death family antitoxin [Phycisphaerales bacterium]|nr:type II toxin-antitoxin system prevent-host-death family antitoxin [Phycisphaerales bacterium]